MKFSVLLLTLGLTICAAISDEELWSEFKKKHDRHFKSQKEDQHRFLVFQENLRSIEQHNEKYVKGQVSYSQAITDFADMSQDEFLRMLDSNYIDDDIVPSGKAPIKYHTLSGNELPNEFSWVPTGAVSKVKNQGRKDGYCWAFATTSLLESHYFLKTGEQVSLSEQNLIDCSEDYGNGPNGGTTNWCYKYIRENGIETAEDYPFTGVKSTCKFSPSKNVLNVTHWRNIVIGDEHSLQDALVSIGPIKAGISAANFGFYNGSVSDHPCPTRVNHAVLVVGYGTENGKDYWLVKNSWGPTWGDKGFIKMARNKDNQCEIASAASYPYIQVL